MRQCGLGFPMFTTDHNDMLPPAGWAAGSDTAAGIQISWDSFINKYIGGHASDAEDQFPKVNWVGGSNPFFSLRSYAMVGAGPVQGADADYQRNPSYGLPNLNQAGMLSVGMYWQDPTATTPDWDAPSYKTTVVRDPAGTILLCENTSGQQCAGNIWTCICLGPQSTSPNDLYQMDNSGPQDPTVTTSVNQGALLYKAHKNRFNYVFNDGHVETLKIEDTIGTGTLTAPKGMWTQVQGD
jgi:prepilin-type processing-associated H-X9-DG protein